MNVVHCGRASTALKTCKKHTHPNWEIIFNLSGTNISVIDQTAYPITEGDVMVIPPDVMHDGNSMDEYTDMFIQARHLDFPGPVVIHDYDDSIRFLMQLLSRTLTEQESNYMSICDSLLETICLFIKKYSESPYRYEFVNVLKTEIYRNMDNPDFQIADTIRIMGYNMNYVRRCFQEDTGITPLKYLTELRMTQAKSLLVQETFTSIENVAKQCGFHDSFYFSKLFRQYVGMSPSEYKKRQGR